MGDTSIDQALNSLPESGITVLTLKALDYVVPGEWTNINNFDDMIRDVTGTNDPARIHQISAQANQIFSDPDNGYQRALWLYKATDKADLALGTAAMANKIGEKINFLSFLNRFTPAADTSQTIDLALKIVVELLAFCFMNGLPRDREGIRQFASSLGENYRKESVMRMATLVCVDAIIPLGPDFVSKVGSTLGGLSSSELDSNPLMASMGNVIPDSGEGGRLGFITDSFNSVKNWMGNLTSSRGLTRESVTSKLRKFVEFSDDKLDYLAAFLDLSTNYYAHTGTQTIARNVITRAAEGGGASRSVSLPPMSDFAAAAPVIAPSGDSAGAKALYDYQATSPGYLSIAKGEPLTVIGDERGGWYTVRNATGQQGFVPVTYVEKGGGGSPAASSGSGARTAVLTGDNEGSDFHGLAGDRVTVTGKEKSGWYWATNSRGLSGWVAARLLRFE